VVTETAGAWQREIVDLHEVFERYFLGASDSLARVEQVLADDFTIVGPDGAVNNRATTLAALKAGHAHTESLKIVISGEALLAEIDDVIVANYIESHELALRSNHRRSTVVFRREPSTPNGLAWVRVHETWLDRLPA